MLAELAADAGLPTVATTAAHYATPQRFPLATALAAVRARRSLDEVDGWLPPAGTAHLRSGAEMAARFDAPLPRRGGPGRGARRGRARSRSAWSRPTCRRSRAARARRGQLAARAHPARGGAALRQPRRVPGGRRDGASASCEIIEEKNFPGYFLIVHDIVEFCRTADILCQGRGSAANSAVCYALGITNVDAVAMGLLFERFLSPAREGYPDIDLDIESGRREEVDPVRLRDATAAAAPRRWPT